MSLVVRIEFEVVILNSMLFMSPLHWNSIKQPFDPFYFLKSTSLFGGYFKNHDDVSKNNPQLDLPTVLIGWHEFCSWSHMVLDGCILSFPGPAAPCVDFITVRDIENRDNCLLIWANMAVAFSVLIFWNRAPLVSHREFLTHVLFMGKKAQAFVFTFL